MFPCLNSITLHFNSSDLVMKFYYPNDVQWRFSKLGETPKSSNLDWDFPLYKPSSYWGTPMTMKTPIFSSLIPEQHLLIVLIQLWCSTILLKFNYHSLIVFLSLFLSYHHHCYEILFIISDVPTEVLIFFHIWDICRAFCPWTSAPTSAHYIGPQGWARWSPWRRIWSRRRRKSVKKWWGTHRKTIGNVGLLWDVIMLWDDYGIIMGHYYGKTIGNMMGNYGIIMGLRTGWCPSSWTLLVCWSVQFH